MSVCVCVCLCVRVEIAEVSGVMNEFSGDLFSQHLHCSCVRRAALSASLSNSSGTFFFCVY